MCVCGRGGGDRGTGGGGGGGASACAFYRAYAISSHIRALVYGILLTITAITDYAIGLEKLSANVFVDAQVTRRL